MNKRDSHLRQSFSDLIDFLNSFGEEVANPFYCSPDKPSQKEASEAPKPKTKPDEKEIEKPEQSAS